MYGVRMFYGPILSGAATGASAGSALGPIGAGAGAIIGAGVSAFAQGKMNKKMRKWNERMYSLQRQHSLEDWAMQNAYNSPQAQMARLAEAGLNPNMVYGHGTVDNAGSAVRSSSTGSWNPSAPDMGAGISQAATQGLFAPLDMEIKRQQLDNLKTQKTVMESDIVKKTADTLNIGVRTDTGKAQLGLFTDLRQTVVDSARANLDMIGVKKDMMLQANERAILANNQRLSIGVEQIISYQLQQAKTVEETNNLKAMRENLRRSGALQELDIQQRELGINPNSNTAVQMVGRLINAGIPGKLESKFERGLNYHKKWVRPFTKEWFNR